MALKNSRCVLRNLAVLAGMDCAATLGGKLFAALGVPETNIVVLYLFAVLLVARLPQGYQYGILASVPSLGGCNFYFPARCHRGRRMRAVSILAARGSRSRCSRLGGRSFTAVWRTPGSCAPGLPTCAPSTWPARRAFVFGHLYEGRSRAGR